MATDAPVIYTFDDDGNIVPMCPFRYFEVNRP